MSKPINSIQLHADNDKVLNATAFCGKDNIGMEELNGMNLDKAFENLSKSGWNPIKEEPAYQGRRWITFTKELV